MPKMQKDMAATSNRVKPLFEGEVESYEGSQKRQAEMETSIAEWSKLATAYKKELMVRGTVESVMPMEGYGSAVAFVNVYGFSVLVPYDEMVKHSPIEDNISDEIRLKRENNILASMIGANVYLIIKEITGVYDTGKYIVLGSRIEAMERQKAYYLNKNESGKCKVHAGDKVKADIIAVGRGRMVISIYGFEKKINIFLGTAKYTEGLNLIYAPGDTLEVRIQDIEYDKKGCVSNILAERRSLETEELIQKNKDKVKVGGYANAYITSISKFTDDLIPTYRLYIPAWDITAISRYVYVNNSQNPLRSGDLVLIHLDTFNGKDEPYATIHRKIR